MRKSHWSHRRRKPSFQVSLLTLESELASATLGAKVPQKDKDISFPGTLRDTSHLPRGPCMAGGPVGRGEVSLHSHTPPPLLQSGNTEFSPCWGHLGQAWYSGRFQCWQNHGVILFRWDCTHCPYSPSPRIPEDGVEQSDLLW